MDLCGDMDHIIIDSKTILQAPEKLVILPIKELIILMNG